MENSEQLIRLPQLVSRKTLNQWIAQAMQSLLFAPVTFHYKKEFDPNGILQFGLVAEEVEKVDSDLVKRDRDGKLQTVRYDAVNAMLLNEFLKAHRKIKKQETAINQLKAALAQQQKDFQAMTARQEEEIDALT